MQNTLLLCPPDDTELTPIEVTTNFPFSRGTRLSILVFNFVVTEEEAINLSIIKRPDGEMCCVQEVTLKEEYNLTRENWEALRRYLGAA